MRCHRTLFRCHRSLRKCIYCCLYCFSYPSGLDLSGEGLQATTSSGSVSIVWVLLIILYISVFSPSGLCTSMSGHVYMYACVPMPVPIYNNVYLSIPRRYPVDTLWTQQCFRVQGCDSDWLHERTSSLRLPPCGLSALSSLGCSHSSVGLPPCKKKNGKRWTWEYGV